MTPAYQAVQSGHAAIQFQYEYPEIAKEWFKNSNYLIYLSVENEESLKNLIEKAELKGIKCSVFREPDISNEITAIALEPSDATRRLTSSLPLALKEFNFFGIDKNSRKEIEYV